MSDKPRWRWPRLFPQAKTPEGISASPLKLRQPRVPVEIAAGGTMLFRGQPVNAIFDSGSTSAAIIDQASANELNLNVLGHSLRMSIDGETKMYPVVHIDIKLAGATLCNVPAAVISLPPEVKLLLGIQITALFNVDIRQGQAHITANEERLNELELFTGKKWEL